MMKIKENIRFNIRLLIIGFCLFIVIARRPIILFAHYLFFKYELIIGKPRKFSFPYYAINYVNKDEKIKYIVITHDISFMTFMIENRDKDIVYILDEVINKLPSNTNIVNTAIIGRKWIILYSKKTDESFFSFYTRQKLSSGANASGANIHPEADDRQNKE